jgi:FkbH-like protein
MALDSLYSQLSLAEAFDIRYFYSAKSPYTLRFFANYASQAKAIFLAATGQAKKALIFDCDNTLWQGILGEDGFDGIKMSGHSSATLPFEAVQHLAVALSRRGVLIGLCSKNNLDDVNFVLNTHPDMILNPQYISIKTVNWQDKVTNLKAIAAELNIDLDSLVFIDDSDFEINLIRTALPQVSCFQVPKQTAQYPALMTEVAQLFYQLSFTDEDSQRGQMIQQQQQRTQEQAAFADIEDYLASLAISLTVYSNDQALVPRMAQMTQKTNQFNLTSKRYSESEISTYVASDTALVFAVNVADKFGDNGITALAIIEWDPDDPLNARIDTLLMSCRIIGRNVEFAFFDRLVDDLRSKGIASLSARYDKTFKNVQVADLYDRLGFTLDNAAEQQRDYHLLLSRYQKNNLEYIGVADAYSEF